MRTSSRRERGFTLLEMGIVLIMMVAMTALLQPSVQKIYDDYKRQVVMEDMIGILARLEVFRNSVTSNTRQPSGVMTYTWQQTGNGNNFITVDSFNAMAGTTLPTTNPFGRDYSVRANDGRAEVRTRVPPSEFSFEPLMEEDSVSNPGTTILTMAEQRKPRTKYGDVDSLKHRYYLELRR